MTILRKLILLDGAIHIVSYMPTIQKLENPNYQNTKKPRWNEIFDIDLHYGHVELRFEVYDWDRVGSGDFMEWYCLIQMK